LVKFLRNKFAIATPNCPATNCPATISPRTGQGYLISTAVTIMTLEHKQITFDDL